LVFGSETLNQIYQRQSAPPVSVYLLTNGLKDLDKYKFFTPLPYLEMRQAAQDNHYQAAQWA
jgi:hypothetical protein